MASLVLVNNVHAKYPIQSSIKGGAIGFTSPISSLKSTINGARMAVFGQDDYTANIKAVLSKYGKYTIKSMVLVRSPVDKAITTALDVVSLGKFKKRMEEKEIHDLFHLQADITLSNRAVVRVEKNEVLNVEEGTTQKKGQEEEEVKNIPSGLTLNQLMENCKQRMGKNFFPYASKSNNCQDFLLNLLQASKIGDQSDYDFIKQETDYLFKNQSTLKKVANFTTDLGAKTALLLKGGNLLSGISSKANKTISSAKNQANKKADELKSQANSRVSDAKSRANQKSNELKSQANSRLSDAKSQANKKAEELKKQANSKLSEAKDYVKSAMPSESDILKILENLDRIEYSEFVHKFNKQYHGIAEQLNPSNFGDEDDYQYIIDVIMQRRDFDFIKVLLQPNYFELLQK